jgi:hypothetical protein
MTYPEDNKNNNKNKHSQENLFQIMDGIIDQLNITKKIFIIMIITIMIIPPLSFVITFALFGPPFPFEHDGRTIHERFGPQPQFGHYFGIARFIPFLISLVWLGIGIRQWFVLSKWTRKYERYKELQRKIDQKLDYDDTNDNGDKDNSQNI